VISEKQIKFSSNLQDEAAEKCQIQSIQVGLFEVLFTAISFSCCFEMAEEGFLRDCLPAVGAVELLFLASFSSCSFEMAEGFSRDFLPAVCGVEILFSASFFPC
jgi:hypothetical protein